MKYERPLRRPSQMIEGIFPEAPAAQPQLSRHGGSAKALSAHPAAPVGNSKACPPKPPPHNRKQRGTAGARKPYRPTLRRPSETARHAPRSPRRTTANRAVRRERESPIGPPCGAHREQQRRALRNPRDTTANRAVRRERSRKSRGAHRRRDEASCVVPPLASDYFPLARCRLTRRNSRSAVCALRFAKAA